MIQTAQERLTEALNARHKLQIGQQVKMIRRDGQSVEFSGVADVGALDQYIAELRSELSGAAYRRGPMGARL